MVRVNVEEIDELVDQYGGQLYKFCRKLALTKEDADDLYQETFVKLVESLHKIDKNKNPKSFLFSIAIYNWKSNCRKYARRQRIAPVTDMDETSLQSDGFNLESDLIERELSLFLQSEINCLVDKFKIPIYLFYTAQMTTDEIAAIMKIPSGTVKSRLHKARKILKKRLEAAGYE